MFFNNLPFSLRKLGPLTPLASRGYTHWPISGTAWDICLEAFCHALAALYQHHLSPGTQLRKSTAKVFSRGPSTSSYPRSTFSLCDLHHCLSCHSLWKPVSPCFLKARLPLTLSHCLRFLLPRPALAAAAVVQGMDHLPLFSDFSKLCGPEADEHKGRGPAGPGALGPGTSLPSETAKLLKQRFLDLKVALWGGWVVTGTIKMLGGFLATLHHSGKQEL